MKILLINQNATVEKLVRLSAQRIGLELAMAENAQSAAGGAEWVLIDHDSLAGESAESLRGRFAGAKIGLLYPKTGAKKEGFDLYIEKPFLPTELIEEFNEKIKGGADTPLAGATQNADSPLADLSALGGDLGSDLGDLSSDLGNLDSDLGDLGSDLSSDLGGDLTADLAGVGDLASEPALEATDSGGLGDLGSPDMPADDLGADLGALDGAIETPSYAAETQIADASADFAPRPADDLLIPGEPTLNAMDLSADEDAQKVLDIGEVSEVKELLGDINEPILEEAIPEPAVDLAEELPDMAAPIAEEPLADEPLVEEPLASAPLADEPLSPALDEAALDEAAALLNDDLSADLTAETPAAPEEGDLKIDFGENEGLLNEEDVADIQNAQMGEESDLDLTALDAPTPEEMPADELAVIPEPDFGENLGENLGEDLGADLAAELPVEPETPLDFAEVPDESSSETPSVEETPDEEFSAIGEPEMAAALGEELPLNEAVESEALESIDEPKIAMDAAVEEPAELEPITPTAEETIAAVANVEKGGGKFIQTGLGTVSTGTLRELLDGMQLTINISFPNK
ncbi:MAG: hypothetical protein LBU73_03230 [Helicobacteraceae bacterium]|jgi:uncharacterized membrane protein|nr:hypothetical protein [Helicobacteraceae bacterium]